MSHRSPAISMWRMLPARDGECLGTIGTMEHDQMKIMMDGLLPYGDILSSEICPWQWAARSQPRILFVQLVKGVLWHAHCYSLLQLYIHLSVLYVPGLSFVSLGSEMMMMMREPRQDKPSMMPVQASSRAVAIAQKHALWEINTLNCSLGRQIRSTAHEKIRSCQIVDLLDICTAAFWCT